MEHGTIIGRRAASTVALAVAVMLVAGVAVSPAFGSESGCAGLSDAQVHEARRAEQSSAYLPDCRAYEQVTPIGKDSGEPEAALQAFKERELFAPIIGALSALNGERMAWVSEDPGLAGKSSDSLGIQYVSTRGSEGWSTEASVPPQSLETGLACPENPGIVGWSRDFTKGVLADGASQEFSSGSTSGQISFFQEFGCGHAEPALREANGSEIKEPAGFQNLFLRDNETGFYNLVNVTPPGEPTPTAAYDSQPYVPANFLAGSDELEHVAFEEELPLTEEAEKLSPAVEIACKETPKGRACWEGHDDLYVWSEGQQPSVRLVTVLPNGTPTEGILAGSTRNGLTPALDSPTNVADYLHAVSADGSRIFFEAEGNLYVRDNAWQSQSALGSKGECTEPAKACTVQLDRSQVGEGGGGGKWLGANAEGTKVFFSDETDLTSTATVGSGANLYEYELPTEGGRAGRLIDITPDAKAEVIGTSGVSNDGSYVYFVAKGKLTGKDIVAGRNPEESEPTANAENLYLSHDGAVAFIATLDEKDLCDWALNRGCNLPEPGNPERTALTARVSGNGRYLAFNSVRQPTGYDNVGPNCVELHGPQRWIAGSCEEIFLYEVEGNRLVCISCNPNPNVSPSADGAVIDWATLPDLSVIRDTYPQRNLSEAGQVFFETSEGLLQQDSNGLRDVYEYEHGNLQLISSGTGTAPSYFMDASASGSDVFFATAQKLLPRDTDSAYDIYDARVGGGFPEPFSPSQCESEECKNGAQASATFSMPDSATFAGPGNLSGKKAPPTPKPKKTIKKIREAKLRRALKSCSRRYRHSRPKQAMCKQRARRKYGPTGTGARYSHSSHGGGGR